jgi:hypothetical protein
MGLLAFIAGGIVIVPLRADLRITVRETFPGGPTTTRVEYYKGNRSRIDWGPGGAYQILDLANKRSISVDPAKREYSLHTSTHTERNEDPSQTIVIEVESRDTGEQRQMFGHPVRHVITTERRRTEYTDKPPTESDEVTTDGWYMEVPVPDLLVSRSRVGTVSVLTVYTVERHGRPSVPKTPKIKITRNGPVPRGLAVWEKTGNNLVEVTEFSEAPLDEKLFEIPQEFRRIVNPIPGEPLSWSDQLLWHWQEFLDWLDDLL